MAMEMVLIFFYILGIVGFLGAIFVSAYNKNMKLLFLEVCSEFVEARERRLSVFANLWRYKNVLGWKKANAWVLKKGKYRKM